MLREIDGFVVEVGKQVLLSGSWGSDDCDWDWDFDYHYFTTKEDADRYFAKQKQVFSADYPCIRMRLCTMTFDGGYMRYADHGDPIKEYGLDDNGNTCIYDI